MAHDARSELRSVSVFSHLNAEKAPFYRAILRVFVEAKASFVLHLRPGDVRTVLRARGELDETDAGSLESALAQLCDWHNLEAHRDTADVATVEEFYRPRFLYQLAAEGEAAERALTVFYESLEQTGELQTTALTDIRQYLGELEELAEARADDDGSVHRVLHLLTVRFEQLTARAQTFLRSLQRTIDLQGITIEAFLTYKQALIDYLERFIGELVIATHDIAERLAAIAKHGSQSLLAAAARRDTIDVLEHEREARRVEAEKLWEARWAGFRGWFISEPGRQSQAEILRSRARAAIPALLGAVARINERRMTHSDRVADLHALARWFAEAPSDGDAHRLWRAAFGLTSARHLKVDEETLLGREQQPVSPQTSWLKADQLQISPRVRQTGRHAAKGPAKSIIDRTRERELLEKMARDEASQVAAAQSRLATVRRTRLSELGPLDATEFDVLLDLLGEALALKISSSESVVAFSSDGALRIQLEPVQPPAQAVVQTIEGAFQGADHLVTITPAFDELPTDALALANVESAR